MGTFRVGRVSGLEIQLFEDVTDAVSSIFDQEKPAFGKLIAVNAEKILAVRENNELHDILDNQAILYADGISIVWHLRRQGIPARKVAGCELWVELMKFAGQNNFSVCLIGATESVNKKTAEKLKREFDLNVTRHNGFFSDEEELLSDLKKNSPRIVTVALGSPKQEYLMQRMLAVHPDALYMGVGGSYDIYVGELKRAPSWMLRANLEFLYRLLQQPSRYKRHARLVRFFLLSLLGRIR